MSLCICGKESWKFSFGNFTRNSRDVIPKKNSCGRIFVQSFFGNLLPDIHSAYKFSTPKIFRKIQFLVQNLLINTSGIEGNLGTMRSKRIIITFPQDTRKFTIPRLHFEIPFNPKHNFVQLFLTINLRLIKKQPQTHICFGVKQLN